MESNVRLFNCIEDENSGSGGLLDEIFKNRPEHTLAGAALGTVEDLVDAPATPTQKYERAARNDMAAQFLADTVAIVPKFGALEGGMARAALLMDPHEGLEGNALSFGKNLVEGAALNKVGKMMLPGSSLQTFAEAKLGKGLMAESLSHVTAGFGFGAVKSGFDPRSWKDGHGAFSLAKGTRSILEGGAVGATINLPAGLLGVRVARGSASLLAAGRVSEKTATMVAGVTSGYAGGMVFGGVDAAMKGKSLGDTLRQMNLAGMAGAFTGSFVSAFDKGDLLSRYSDVPRLRQQFRLAESLPYERQPLPALDSADTSPGRVPMFDRRQATSDLTHELLSFEDASKGPLESFGQRLINPRNDTIEMRYLKEGAPDKFDSFQHFLEHTGKRKIPVRIYDVEGHTAKLVVKRSYAQRQENLQKLHQVAKRDIPFDQLGMAQRREIDLQWKDSSDRLALLGKYMDAESARQSLPVVEARKEYLSKSPQGGVPLGEFVAAMDQLPNPKLIDHVLLYDERNPTEAWSKIQYKDPTHETAASAEHGGKITFYLPPERRRPGTTTIFENMRHEWSHLVEYASPDDSDLFSLAARVDKSFPKVDWEAPGAEAPPLTDATGKQIMDKYYAREYASSTDGENWAVHMGEEMLSPDSDRFITLAQEAPVRTAVLSRALVKQLGKAPVSMRSPHAEIIANRLKYAEDIAMPAAVKVLEQRMKSGTVQEKAMAAELMGFLGSAGENTTALRQLAASPSSHVVPEGVENVTEYRYQGSARGARVKSSVDSSRTLADIAFDSMLRLRDADPLASFDFLVDQGRPGSVTRDMAISRLASLEDPRAHDYGKFLRLAGNADNLPELLSLMRSMPDRAGKEMVFDEVLALGGDSPEFQQSIVRETLAHIPELRLRALDMVAMQREPRMERLLVRLSGKPYDKRAAARASELLDKIHTSSNLEQATELLSSGNEAKQLQGLQLASGMNDHRMIKPLLRSLAEGSPAVREKATTLLGEFKPNMISYYARELSREGTRLNTGAIQHIRGGK